MSIVNQINTDIKSAMLAKEKAKLESLRAIKAALLLAGTAKGANGNVDDTTATKTIQKLVKQREDSAAIYKEQNREDLAEIELAQALIMKPYLPKQLSEEEIQTVLTTLISKVGASGPADFGKVMGMASKELSGKADGKIISSLLKTILV